jgi:hypothetical protein
MSTYCLLSTFISFYRWKLHMPTKQPRWVIHRNVVPAWAYLKGREV